MFFRKFGKNFVLDGIFWEILGENCNLSYILRGFGGVCHFERSLGNLGNFVILSVAKNP